MAKNIIFKPTPYKVSTITATGSVGTNINLDVLYENIKVVLPEGERGCVYTEYGHKKSDTYYRGYSKKLAVTRRKTTVSKRFDNQVTVVLRADATSPSCINIKVFKNGNIQMTGLKFTEQGGSAIQFIVDELLRIRSENDPSIVDDAEKLGVYNYSIRLINCDFRIGFDIKRDKLYKVIQNEYEGVFCSYEPCIYPGVKIQYNWNEMYPHAEGTCICTTACSGKGTGCGNGQCKKITIAVFQSGCIIITGAQSHEQINKAYDFTCEAIQKHMDVIKKEQLIQ